jgi:hypothetical protein
LPWRARGTQVGEAQLEVVVGAGGPLLEVGHLHAGGRVDAVGGLHERDEQHGLELGRERLAGDGLADGVDAGAVLRLEEAGLARRRSSVK